MRKENMPDTMVEWAAFRENLGVILAQWFLLFPDGFTKNQILDLLSSDHVLAARVEAISGEYPIHPKGVSSFFRGVKLRRGGGYILVPHGSKWIVKTCEQPEIDLTPRIEPFAHERVNKLTSFADRPIPEKQ